MKTLIFCVLIISIYGISNAGLFVPEGMGQQISYADPEKKFSTVKEEIKSVNGFRDKITVIEEDLVYETEIIYTVIRSEAKKEWEKNPFLLKSTPRLPFKEIERKLRIIKECERMIEVDIQYGAIPVFEREVSPHLFMEFQYR